MRLITRGSEFKIRRILPKWIFHLLLNALCLGAPIMNEKETGICPHLTKCRKVQCLSFSAFLFFLQPNLHWAIFNELCTISSSGVPKRKTLCLSRTYKVSLACLHFHYLSPPPLSVTHTLSLSLCLSLSVSLQSYHTVSHTHTQPYLHTHSLSHSHSCIRTTSTFYIPTLTTYTSTPTLDFAHAHPPVCPDAKI